MERYIGWYSYAFDRFFFYVHSGEIWYYSYKIKNGSLFDLKIRNLLICRLKNKTISLMANIFESPMNSYFIIISQKCIQITNIMCYVTFDIQSLRYVHVQLYTVCLWRACDQISVRRKEIFVTITIYFISTCSYMCGNST